MNPFLGISNQPPVRLVTITQFGRAIAILWTAAAQEEGVTVELYSVDISSAYRRVAKQSRDTFKQGVLTPKGPARDLRGQFGDRGMPGKFTRITDLVVHRVRKELKAFDESNPPSQQGVQQWLKERQAAGLNSEQVMSHMQAYLDDIMGGTIKDSWRCPDTGRTRPEAHCDRLMEVVAGPDSFNLPIKAAKVIRPTGGGMKGLGIMVDSGGRCLYFTEEKRLKTVQQLSRDLLEVQTQTRQVIHSNMMQLVWMGQIHFPIRPFLTRGFRLAGSSSTSRRWRTAKVQVPEGVRSDISQVTELLKVPTFLPLFPRVNLPGPLKEGSWVIMEDASSSVGLGSFLAEPPGYHIMSQWEEWEKEELHINTLEAATTPMSIDVFGRMVPGSELVVVIYECVDNTVAQHSMQSGASKPKEVHMNRVLTRRLNSLKEVDCTSCSMRITTKENLFSDLLSRGREEEFMWAARQCGFQPIRLEIPAAVRSLDCLRQ